MVNAHSAMILSLVTLIFVIIVLKFPENFTNYLNLKNSLINNNQNNHQNILTNELKSLEEPELLPDLLEDEVKEIVDTILEHYNKLYNKKLIRVNIERLEKTVDNENKIDNYSVILFVFNYFKESNSKVLLEFSMDYKNHIQLKKMEVVGSRDNLFKIRGGDTTRNGNADVEKPKVDMNKVDNIIDIPLDFSLFNESESKNKMVDRNSWILPKAREQIGNIETFPSRQMSHELDCLGINLVEHPKKDSPGGINYGSRPFTLVPHFMKHNFEACYGDYTWIFDKDEDIESKPIGVG